MIDIRAVENRIRLQYTQAKFEGDEQKAKTLANNLRLIWKIILGKKHSDGWRNWQTSA